MKYKFQRIYPFFKDKYGCKGISEPYTNLPRLPGMKNIQKKTCVLLPAITPFNSKVSCTVIVAGNGESNRMGI